jgi:hypothetical protein
MLTRCSSPLIRLSLIVLAGLCAQPAPAAELEFEVKFFLNPRKTLNSEHQPTKQLLAFFEVKGDPVTMQMQFLDGRGTPLHKKGWNVRLRRVGKKSELTFKRRYKVTDLATALRAAEKDGFDVEEDKWKAQVEWGYDNHRTLTFSKGVELKGFGDGLPDDEEARKVARKYRPGKLDRAGKNNWAKQVLAEAHRYGPVSGRRWRGRMAGVDSRISLEVWEIPGVAGKGKESLVEVSFKRKGLEQARKARAELQARLEKKGWLLKEAVLKTEIILKRFSPTRAEDLGDTACCSGSRKLRPSSW